MYSDYLKKKVNLSVSTDPPVKMNLKKTVKMDVSHSTTGGGGDGGGGATATDGESSGNSSSNS